MCVHDCAVSLEVWMSVHDLAVGLEVWMSVHDLTGILEVWSMLAWNFGCLFMITVLAWFILALQCPTGSSRPKHLLVFVNPFGGKKRAPKVFEKVRPFFDLAGITLDVIGEFCIEQVNLGVSFTSDGGC